MSNSRDVVTTSSKITLQLMPRETMTVKCYSLAGEQTKVMGIKVPEMFEFGKIIFADTVSLFTKLVVSILVFPR